MIKELTMYTVVCDNCGADSNEGGEYSCWTEKSVAEDMAMDSDWIKEGSNHYCPDCYTYDDNDKLVINLNRSKLSLADLNKYSSQA